MLSYSGRLILLNSVLLCFRSMRPQKVCYKNLTFIDRGFFWQGDDHKKKYRLAK
jgi:hypothetical protein